MNQRCTNIAARRALYADETGMQAIFASLIFDLTPPYQRHDNPSMISFASIHFVRVLPCARLRKVWHFAQGGLES